MTEAARGERGTWRYLGMWKGGALDLAATRAHLPANERDAGQLILDERPGQLRFVPSMGRSGTWFIWDGRHHRPDDSSELGKVILSYADRALHLLAEVRREVMARAALEAGQGADEAAIKARFGPLWRPWEETEKYHHGLHRRGAAALAGYLAGFLCGTSADELEDGWPHLLNTSSRVVDLARCADYDHDPRWNMTYCVETPYEPGAVAPGFEQLVWHVSGYNAEIARYLIRMLGYSLLGSNPDALIFFLAGPTASGKSVLLGVIADILGTLAHDSSAELITSSRNGVRHPRVENSIAGKRLVIITETSERMRIDEGQLKRIADSGRMSRGQLYVGTEIGTPITWTVWSSANELPTIPSFEDAVKRRVRLVPAGSTIPEDQRDRGLRKRLVETEAPGILAMLIEGCREYHRIGEARPPEVELATAEYQSEQDTAEAFRQEGTRAILAAEVNGQGTPRVGQLRIWRSYMDWCQANRMSGLRKHAFLKRFRELPGIQYDEVQKDYLWLTLDESWRKDHEDHPGWPPG